MLRKAENTLFFLTLLFLPTQLGRHFWPDFSFVYSLRVDYLSPAIYFWDLLALALVCLWIFRKPSVNKQALNLFFLFMLALSFSLFNAGNPAAGFVRLEQYGIAGLFGVYLASQKKEAPEAGVGHKIWLPLFLGITAQALIAVVQTLSGSTIGLWILGERSFTITTAGIAKFDFYGREFLRPYATFPHPNVLAGYLLVTAVLLSGKKAFWPVVVSAVGITLAMSRTAITAGFVMLLLLAQRKWKIFALIIILLLSPVLFTRFSSIFNFDSISLLRREELLGAAWELFLKNPFFGIGLNNFIPALADNLVTGPSRFLQPVHNIFLLTLAESGLFGLAGLIIFMAYPLIKSRNFCIWLTIIFLGLFDHYFLTLPQGYRLLFTVWGLSFVSRR